MEITVIDDSDYVGWMAAATRIGEIYMTDVKSMVANVLKKAKGKKISRLNVLDHGNSTSMQIGNDRVSLKTISKFKKELSKLKGQFTKKGFIHLQHCKIGNNHKLLLAISKIVGVPVYAGTGNHNPVYRFNFGDYVRCEPKRMTCKVKVPRPS